MNKHMLLDYLVSETEAKADAWWISRRCDTNGHIYELAELAFEVNGRKGDVPIPDPTGDPEIDATMLESSLGGNVSLVSFVLNAWYPSEYCFYRVSDAEQEIAAGLSYLADSNVSASLRPLADRPWTGMPRNGLEQYLFLNNAIMGFARETWPHEPVGRRHVLLAYFIYQELSALFRDPLDTSSYWLMVADPKYFRNDERDDEVEWSARKGVKTGDIVFMYRKSPVSAITDVYRVSSEPRVDPWSAWRGVWVDMKRVAHLDPGVTYATLKAAPELEAWPRLRGNLQGVMCEQLPYRYYNRILELMPAEAVTRACLVPELLTTPDSGNYDNEADFEDKVVTKLIQGWAFRAVPQHAAVVWITGEPHPLRVDFLVQSQGRLVTLFEDKVAIPDDRTLRMASEQAKTYALQLALPSFIIAAPEGYWIYRLSGAEKQLWKHLTLAEMNAQRDDVRRQLLAWRG